MFMQNSNNS